MRSRRGFTLLEVMAAVVLLFFVVTYLAQAQMSGLAHEGDAARRMRASLLADRLVTELEAAMAGGEDVPVGITETEEDELRGVTEVAAVDPASLGLDALLAATGESTEIVKPQWEVLDAEVGGLRSASVRVRWTEGADEREVTRTTFLFQPGSIAALQELNPPEQPR